MKHAERRKDLARSTPGLLAITTSASLEGGLRRTLKAGDALFRQGDERKHVYVVEAGWLKLSRMLVDGQRQIVGFPTRGSLLGFEAPYEYLNDCIALTTGITHAFPASAIAQLCRNPRFGEALLRQLGVQLGDAQAQLSFVGAQSATQKTAVFLMSMADASANAKREFALPMRRGEIGEFLGLRLETVSRTFGAFRKRGWISMPAIYRCRITNDRALSAVATGVHKLSSLSALDGLKS